MIYGIFEAAMLLCFAASWPFNLLKAYRARTNVGTSIIFMSVVLLGYIFGIANKVVNNDMSYVMAFYILDLALVATGILIYVRNGRLDRQREA
jgi:membrane protein DedA with SNARE-associated domain